MLFHIPQLSRYVWISGFGCTPVRVEELIRITQEKLPEVCLQLVDLGKVAGSRYLLLATYNALKSFYSKHRVSRTLNMEILLYVSGNRQINEALKLVGITTDTHATAAIAVGPSRESMVAVTGVLEQLLSIKSTDGLLDSWSANRINAVRENFGIDSEELSAAIRKDEGAYKAIERLAIERSTLLTVRK